MDSATTLALLKPKVVLRGLPESVTQTFMDAVADAGLSFVDATKNESAAASESTETKRLQATGFPGVWICGAKVGSRGWLAWTEWTDKGVLVRSYPAFLAGSGLFNPA